MLCLRTDRGDSLRLTAAATAWHAHAEDKRRELAGMQPPNNSL
jgi:hypothetical protein